MRIAFDTEFNLLPKGHPISDTHILCSWACLTESTMESGYYKDADFISRLRDCISKATLLITLNGKIDIHALTKAGIKLPKGVRVWDCQIAEFVMSGQTNSFASMDQLCKLYEIKGKEGGLHSYWDVGVDTPDIPEADVVGYNEDDVRRTLAIYEAQLKDSRLTPQLHKLILLEGADLLVLQQMEWNGLKYNKSESIRQAAKAQTELDKINEELFQIASTTQINFDSGEQLSCFLYGGTLSIDNFEVVNLVYKSGSRKGESYQRNKKLDPTTIQFNGFFKPLKRTELAKSLGEDKKPDLSKPQYYQTGEPILKQLAAKSKLQKRIIELLLKRADLSKQIESFFVALPKKMDEMGWGDYLHPQFNQVVARTGRLSCSSPNAQQFPPEIDKLIESRYD